MEETISGLIIKDPWVRMILSSSKTWEIRGTSTQKRGWIAIIKSGTKKVFGVCKIIDVIGPLSIKDLKSTIDKHLIPIDELNNNGLPYKETYAWILDNPLSLKTPVSYIHPSGAITWVNIPYAPEIKNLIDSFTINRYLSPLDSTRKDFLESLASDLNLIGHSATYDLSDSHLSLDFIPVDFSKLKPEEIGNIYKKLRDRDLNNSASFILEMEKNGVLDLVINGNELDITRIKPEIRICKNNREKDIFRYFRNVQSVPTTEGAFRRISALVFDMGQPKEYLMGVIGLSGVGYSVKDRDDFLDWTQIDSKVEAKRVKDLGLKRILQLSVCMPVPPYNHLHLGKLLSLLSFSNPIQATFQKKYGQPLLGLQTTSVKGVHAPIFRRVHPNRINDSMSYHDYSNELFYRIGEVSPYSYLMVSNNTFDKALNLIKTYGPQKSMNSGRSSSKSEVLRLALQACGVNRDVLLMNKRGLYFGFLHSNNMRVLKSGLNPDGIAVLELDVTSAFNYWKNEIFSDRRINEIEKFSRQSIALSANL